MGTKGQMSGALTTRQVAELENVTCARVVQWIKDDRYNIHAVKVGGQYYIPEDVYKEFKRRSTQGKRNKPVNESLRRRNKPVSESPRNQQGNPWENLAHTIVKGVVMDYKSARRSGNKAMMLHHKKELQSDWIRFLLGGLDVDYLLNKIDRITE